MSTPGVMQNNTMGAPMQGGAAPGMMQNNTMGAPMQGGMMPPTGAMPAQNGMANPMQGLPPWLSGLLGGAQGGMGGGGGGAPSWLSGLLGGVHGAGGFAGGSGPGTMVPGTMASNPATASPYSQHTMPMGLFGRSTGY
jgi:hypothetical protein